MLHGRRSRAERERYVWLRALIRRLSTGLASEPRGRRRPWPVPGRGEPLFECSRQAHERGLRLLCDNLSTLQREQYEKLGYFDVVGGTTGRRYRIRHGRSMNVDQLDSRGRRICGWCFFPEGRLVAGDVMLAQKLALELFEREALQLANRLDWQAGMPGIELR
jgi:hypothetical protein